MENTKGIGNEEDASWTVGFQNKSPQNVPQWNADCFELNTTLAAGSREISVPPWTT